VLKAGVVASLVVGVGAPERALAAAPCDKGGTNVVVASRQAVVVRWRVHEHRVHYWACLRSTGRAVFLIAAGYEDPDGAEQRLVDESQFSLGGRFVAFTSVGCGEKCADDVVDVYDLGSGRRIRSVQPGRSAKVLVSTHGALALVQDDGERRSIRVWDSRGTTTVTRGPRAAMPVFFIRADGDVLRWRQGGVSHAFLMR
jgi:hypothetical protein